MLNINEKLVDKKINICTAIPRISAIHFLLRIQSRFNRKIILHSLSIHDLIFNLENDLESTT